MTISPGADLYESHLHTTLCKHAVGELTEYAATAHARGLKGMIVTCHCPMPDGYSASVRMAPEQFDDYLRLVEEVAAEWRGRVDVLLGLESDFIPGVNPWLEKLHARAPFHYILGSVHPQVPQYRQIYRTGDPFDYQKVYFDHLAQAAETGLYDSLAHPDLIKNEAPKEWQLDRIMPDILRALDRIAATGISMELNTSGLQKTIPEMNPGPEILREIAQRGIPMVLGADAHKPSRVAAQYEEALDLLETAGFKSIGVFRDRKRREIPIDDARASLKR